MAAAVALNVLVLLALAATAGYVALERRLPAVAQLAQTPLAQPLQIESRDGRRIAEFGDERRVPLDEAALEPMLVRAVLAAEDANFYEHPGFDTSSLLRAGWQLLRTGQPRQGGSTITMQVARNFYLSQEKTFLRKALEILLAVRIEQNLSKDQILGLYVNKIFLGYRAYGFGAAARIYYGRSVDQLSIAQMAMLAGLPKAPSRDNPLVNPQRAVERRNYVLGRMYALGYIDQDQYQRAVAEPDTARHYGFVSELDAPFVAEMARAWMVEHFGEVAYTAGYRVITTIDSTQQALATKALRAGLRTYDRRHGFRGPIGRVPLKARGDVGAALAYVRALPDAAELHKAAYLPPAGYITSPDGDALPLQAVSDDLVHGRWQPEPGDVVYLAQGAKGWALAQAPEIEGAFVALQPETGAITALVGGYDFDRSHFNRAVQAQRQPGSTFKPFIYSAALATGYTAASVINDAPVSFPTDTPDVYWRPENYTKRFYGPTRLREALAHSRNLVSVRLLHSVGVEFTRRYCLRFGFGLDHLPGNLSLALGTASTTPLEMAGAYAVIANGGYRVTPMLIDRVLDPQGQIVWQAPRTRLCDGDCDVPPAQPEATVAAPRVIPATDAYVLNSMLHDVIDYGTAVRARSLGRPDLSGKTGTTNDERDAWFVGFNRSLLAAAWLGFDQPRSLGKGETGARAALPIWMDFMAPLLASIPVSALAIPDGLVSLRVDRHTGQRTSDNGPDSYFEWFSADRLPAGGESPEPATPQALPKTGETNLF
jgi:penicillin-binding protein 1A